MSWPGLCVLGSDRAWFCGHWGAHEFFDGRSIALYSGHLLPSEPHGQTQSSHLFLLWDSLGRDPSWLRLPGLWLHSGQQGSGEPGCERAALRTPGLRSWTWQRQDRREHLNGACWEHCWGSGLMGGA